MNFGIGENICTYRQLARMTQEELAAKLGVTPQAVSKWERGNGLPDVSMVKDLCSILKISANKLLGTEAGISEDQTGILNSEIKNNLISEPILLEFAANMIPYFVEGLQTDYINHKRIIFAKNFGILIPEIRLKDNEKLDENQYRILCYDEILQEGTIATGEEAVYNKIIDEVFSCGKKYFDRILNKQIVKNMIDNLKEKYPAMVEGLIPEKITYLQIERKLQEKIRNNDSIRDLIHILEEMEEEM